MRKKRVAYIKLRKRKNLGLLRRISVVEKYYSREDADACTLKGEVFPVIQANKILKDFEAANENKKYK